MNLILAFSVFVIGSCTLILTLVISYTSAKESRIQIIMSKILDMDMEAKGRPSEKLIKMLDGRNLKKPNCTCSGRPLLLDQYRKLRFSQRIVEKMFLTAFFISLIAIISFILKSTT